MGEQLPLVEFSETSEDQLQLGAVIESWGGSFEEPMDLYRDVFWLGHGLIQKSGEEPGEFKSNPVIIGYDGSRMHRKIMFEDTFEDTLREFQDYEWAFMSGCTYWGRLNTAERQSKLYAMIIDLDGVTPSTLDNFFSGAILAGVYPIPNHLVLSGHGVHLYYVLEEPLDLYPHIKTQIKEARYELIDRVWNGYTSKDPHIQHQGINQGFRIAGGKTKIEGVRARAYKFPAMPLNPVELNNYTFGRKDLVFESEKRFKPTKHTLAEAKTLFPEWYERVIVDKEQSSRQWYCHPKLYDWWLGKIAEGATYGHRYFCIMTLAIYAAKCGIYDREKVRADAIDLLPHFNEIERKHPFTEADIDSALDCLDSRYVTFPRHDIQKIAAIRIDPNKRNGRPQQQHLEIARAVRDIIHPDGSWRYAGGAPTKRQQVRAWREANPAGRKIDCERETGLSRPTVLKWWDSFEEIEPRQDDLPAEETQASENEVPRHRLTPGVWDMLSDTEKEMVRYLLPDLDEEDIL